MRKWIKSFLDRNSLIVIPIFGLIIGMLISFLDAIMDYFFFYDKGFLNLLAFNTPPHEIYIRTIITLSFLFFGIGLSRIVYNLQEVRNQLYTNKENFRTTLQSIGDAVLVVDIDANIKMMNEECEKLTGYKFEEVKEKNLEDIVYIVNIFSRETVRNPIRKVIGNGYTQLLDENTILIAKDGVELQIADSASPIRDYDGTITGGVLVFRDITEQSRKEREVKEREEELQAIFDTVDSGIILVNKNTYIIEANNTMARMLNCNYDDLIGTSYMDHVHSSESEEASSNFNKLVNGEVTHLNIERLYKRKDGTNFWGTLSAKRLYYPNGSFWCLVGSITDINERKIMEERLTEMSLKDILTGLYNRNFFEEEMKRLSKERHAPMGVLVCDLDGLKFINDTLGHEYGDKLLKKTSSLLKQNFRSSDIVARIGGDEFAVLLTETKPEIVEQMIKRLRETVENYNNSNPSIPISLSMGYSLNGGREDIQQIFREADDKMYREKIQREDSSRNYILQALTKSLQVRDFETEGHSDRLRNLIISLANSFNLPQDFINELSLLARFHDIGKVGVSDNILYKEDSLTEEESEEMRLHSAKGHQIASSIPDLEPIADWILKHHERWDGTGYPLGLSGEDIPLASRLLAIVDSYDAMTSNRPYRKALTKEEAIAEIRNCSGTQFDPQIVEKFIQIINEQ